MSACRIVVVFFLAFLRDKSDLAAENLALRQQLAVLERSGRRPRLRKLGRIFWVWLSRLWPTWRSALLLVKPDTVVRWHRQGFKLYWRWKSRNGTPGRPKVEREVRDLIRRMSQENPTWGAPRIQSELHLLGYEVAESSVCPEVNCRDYTQKHAGHAREYLPEAQTPMRQRYRRRPPRFSMKKPWRTTFPLPEGPRNVQLGSGQEQF